MHHYGYYSYYSPHNNALSSIWGTITMGIFTLLRVKSTNADTLLTIPCFGSILGSVPQKYCINRVTVQAIPWACCYVFVKCLGYTVFILYVVR